MTRRNLGSWLLGIVLLAAVLAVTAPTGDDAPLDPRSRGPRGAAAVLAVLEELGADVRIAGEVPDDTVGVTVLVLQDRLTPEVQQAVGQWVTAGGRLVLTDPMSPLNPVPITEQLITDMFGAIGRPPRCDLLDGFVDEVESARWMVMDAPPEATAACFPVGTGHGLVVMPAGDGEIAVTGAADALTNANLGRASHGRLAAGLLAPDGRGEVVVLWDAALGGGDTPLLSLLPSEVVTAAWLLGAALVVFALARSRRVGQPVDERMPVRVPGSELVLAIGELLERHGHRDEAAARIRADLRRDLAAALSLPPDTPPDVLAEVAAVRVDGALDADALGVVVSDAPVTDDDGLAAVAAAAARIRQRLRAAGRVPGTTDADHYARDSHPTGSIDD